MAYPRVNWLNGKTGGKPVNSTYLNQMDKGIYDNSVNIEAIKEKNTTQDERLDTLETSSQDYQERITQLEDENKDLYNNQLSSNATGTNIHVEDSAGMKTKRLKVKGYTKQDGTPTPDAPIEIDVVEGINLFDKDRDFKLGYLSNTGSFVSSNTVALFEYIEVEPNQNYTFSRNNTYAYRYCYYDTNKTFISRSDASSLKTGIMATPSNVKYISIFIDYNTQPTRELISNSNIQLEKGIIAHDYVPFNSVEVKSVNKNLFILPESSTQNGITYINNGDGTFDISGTATSTINLTAFESLKDSNICLGDTYTLSTNYTGIRLQVAVFNDTSWISTIFNRSSTLSDLTQTESFPTDKIINKIGYYITISSGETLNLKNVHVQLEKGSIATNFEPHQENSVVYSLKQDNLFDKDSTTLNGYIDSQGGFIKQDGVDVSDFIEVSSKIYSFGYRGSWSSVALYDKNKNFLSRVSIISTYTFDSSTKYIKVNLEHEYLDSIKIYEGMPNSDGTNFMAEDDYIEDGVLNKEWGKIVLDGSSDEAFVYGNNGIFYMGITGYENGEYLVYSNEYVHNNWDDSRLDGYKCGLYRNPGWPCARLWFHNDNYSDVSSFKNALSNNPIEVYYKLATPYKVQLKQTGELKTYKNVSNISNSEDADMDIDYYVDLQTKINELSSAVLAVGGDINV